MLGFIAPLSAGFLFLFNQHSDYILRTDTLGSDILQMILLVMVFLPVGTKLSVDSILLHKQRWGGVLKKIYNFFGAPTPERTSILRFFAFCSYGLLCIYSAFAHLHDPAWIKGYANTQMLTSTYMGRYFEFFQQLFSAYPSIAITLSTISIYGMLFWEVFMIPLVLLSKLTRWFVIIWGWAFLVICLIFLQLGWLAYYEVFVLWPLIFWQNWKLNLNGSHLKIFYDDKCNLCYRTVKFLSNADLFQSLEFAPLSKNQETVTSLGLEASEVARDLHGFDFVNGKLYVGFELYLIIARKVFLLLPFYPVLLLGKLFKIGPLIYELVASNRYKIHGECKLDSSMQLRAKSKNSDYGLVLNNGLFNAVIFTYLVFACVFAFRLPYISNLKVASDVLNGLNIPRYFDTQVYGLAPIDVFNMKDLKMSENIVVFYRIDADGEKTLLPLNSINGSRLYWHESDHIYYGYSLSWRRNRLNYTDNCYINETDHRLIDAVIKLDKNKNKSAARLYEIEYYNQPLTPSEIILKGNFEIPEGKKICTVVYDAANKKPVKVERT